MCQLSKTYIISSRGNIVPTSIVVKILMLYVIETIINVEIISSSIKIIEDLL